MKKIVAILMVISTLTSCQSQQNNNDVAKANSKQTSKTEDEWKNELTREQYEVLREKGTERPFTGQYWNHFEKGKYVCAACGNALFDSDAKFESDCGWPSFDKAIKGSVIYKTDTSYGMERTEVMCANCGGHLGHVFDDGPEETTGKRFCTNSVSIEFVKK
ncbi:peptide-methionine (R)-S-oxide reductase MsrB [Flavobacterium sp. PLA-1-15]|uniref:peptide-methionine (R)-S-oxide reductase MsrB n=1 Tax=Flavobacterium sp. PLA-1-15 TaxID=3380533 RepID=UPI003B81CCC6